MKNNIFNITLDDIYWYLIFGRSKRRGTIYHLRNNNFSAINKPVFFLSTGRTGTQWFTDLLKKNKDCRVFHNPYPYLDVQGTTIYNLYKHKKLLSESDIFELAQELFLSAREQHLRYTYKTKKRYIETNLGITFFAHAIANLIPESLFIHLYRHPGEFVRSGARRGYYSGRYDDIRRISPATKTDKERWGKYSQIQKISWLWNETNNYIEDLKKSIGIERVFSFNFNKLTFENIKILLKFCGIELPDHLINNMLYKKINPQQEGNFPEYKNWDKKQKEELKNICGDLSMKYGYEL